MSKKIGIIGAGDIGVIVAELLAIHSYDIKLYNRYHQIDGKPSPYWLSKEGKLMDVTDGLELPNFGSVELTSNLDDLKDCFAVVITAGAKRSSPDETREELARKNASIISGFTNLVASEPETIFLIISNPVDSLTQILISDVSKLTGEEKKEVAKRVFGVSLVDSMRLRNIVRSELKLQKKANLHSIVTGYAIGEHGPTMVPLLSTVKVDGKDIGELLDDNALEEIKKHTILRGNDIIKLTGASSVSGPAYAAMHMIRSIAENDYSELPCSVFDGDVAIGQLVAFKKQKFDHLVPLELTEIEKIEFEKSKNTLLKQYQSIVSN